MADFFISDLPLLSQLWPRWQSQNHTFKKSAIPKRGAKISIFDIWQSNFSFFFSGMKGYDYCCKSTNNVTWLSPVYRRILIKICVGKVAVIYRLVFRNWIEGKGALPARGKNQLWLLTINIRILFAPKVSRLRYLPCVIYQQIFTTVEKTFFSLFFRPIFLCQFF